MGNSTLKTLHGAPATNDRCTDEQEDELYGMLKSVLQEIERDENKEDSPGLDWRKIHGEDYQEPGASPMEPFATGQGNNANDNLQMGEWEDHSKDDSSYWSDSPSMWDAIIAEDMDMIRTFQEEMETERQNQDIGDFGWASVHPKFIAKSVEAAPDVFAAFSREDTKPLQTLAAGDNNTSNTVYCLGAESAPPDFGIR